MKPPPADAEMLAWCGRCRGPRESTRPSNRTSEGRPPGSPRKADTIGSTTSGPASRRRRSAFASSPRLGRSCAKTSASCSGVSSSSGYPTSSGTRTGGAHQLATSGCCGSLALTRIGRTPIHRRGRWIRDRGSRHRLSDDGDFDGVTKTREIRPDASRGGAARAALERAIASAADLNRSFMVPPMAKLIGWRPLYFNGRLGRCRLARREEERRLATPTRNSLTFNPTACARAHCRWSPLTKSVAPNSSAAAT
jgi:hypothetical protein